MPPYELFAKNIPMGELDQRVSETASNACSTGLYWKEIWRLRSTRKCLRTMKTRLPRLTQTYPIMPDEMDNDREQHRLDYFSNDFCTLRNGC
ncbi:hypothetical protein TNCV_2900901 [Trichonephila clavipes]|nr:hypothetical protein TNCV_2900901 [Trichonephila clavipes]